MQLRGDLHTRTERSVDGTAVGDFQQSRSLFGSEWTDERQLTVEPIHARIRALCTALLILRVHA
jgi:hypothetical protein